MSVYILHFDQPLGSEKHQAHHYIGFSENMWTLRARIAHHRAGTSRCNIMEALFKRGIGFQLGRVFRGRKYDRNFERKVKTRTHIAELCTVCNGGVEAPYHPRKAQ